MMVVFISHNTDGDEGLICAPTAGNVRVNYCTVFEQYFTVNS